MFCDPGDCSRSLELQTSQLESFPPLFGSLKLRHLIRGVSQLPVEERPCDITLTLDTAITDDKQNLILRFLQVCQPQSLKFVFMRALYEQVFHLASNLHTVPSLKCIDCGAGYTLPILERIFSGPKCHIQSLSLVPYLGTPSDVQSLKESLRTVASLEKVHLYGCLLTQEMFSTVEEAFRFSSGLKNFSMSIYSYPDSLDYMAEFVTSHPQLEAFEIVEREATIHHPCEAGLLADAISTHTQLKRVRLPLMPCQGTRIVQLLNNCDSSESSLKTVDLNFAKLDTIDSRADSLSLKLLEDHHAESFQSLTKAIQLFENLKTLHCSHSTAESLTTLVESVFQNPKCSIESLMLHSYEGSTMDEKVFDRFCLGTLHYTKLRKLVFEAPCVLPLQKLCPKSTLESVQIESSDWEGILLLLEHQRQLTNFQWKCPVDTLDQAFPDLTSVLHKHPTLEIIRISTGQSRPVSPKALEKLLSLANKKGSLRILDLSECILRFDKPCLENISNSTMVHALLINLSRLGPFELDDLTNAMRHNFHICHLSEAVCKHRHSKFKLILKRNNLLQCVKSLVDLHRNASRGVWPHVFARLGSLEEESPSAVFSSILQAIEILETKPCKKRRVQ